MRPRKKLLLALFCTVLIALMYIISRSLNGPSLFALGFAPAGFLRAQSVTRPQRRALLAAKYVALEL